MIRINLAKKQQVTPVEASTKASIGAGSLSKIGGLFKSSNIAGTSALIVKIILPIGLCAGAYFGYDFYITTQTGLMQGEVNQYESEKTKIETELTRIRGFESVKAELEKNEKILRTKIETIQKLVQGRDFAFRTLVSLSQAIPREVWLNEFEETDQGFNIKGNATDVGLVSDLMTRLGRTIYFKDIELKTTSNDATAAHAVFELTARRE